MTSQTAKLVSSFPVQIQVSTDKVKKDRRKPMVRDIIVLRQDRIILSDFSNGLKCFDSNGTPLSKIDKGPSTSMTAISDSKVAFVVPFDSYPETVFVDVDLDSGRLKQAQRISTPTNYRAIASIDGQTWAAGTAWWNGAGAVDVLNMEGEIIRSYNHPDKQTTLLKCATDMVISPSGDFVVADGNASSVIWIDPKADDSPIRCMYSCEREEKLKVPCGLSSDNQGRIYVADQTLNHVIVLSSDGKYIQTILDSEKGDVCRPMGVCIYEDRLYVAESEGDVKVFQLTSQ